MMNDMMMVFLMFAVGVFLGIFYFGGLWLTVMKGVNSKSPALLFVFSFLVRTGITLGGFYFFASGSWQRLVSCALGFIGARFVVIYLTGVYEKRQNNRGKEVTYET